MSVDEILRLTLFQFNALLTDIGVIHAQFNSEKGKGRFHKKTLEEIQEEAKKRGLNPPQFGLVR